MKKQDLVSVIVPFLNGSHWLVEALDSVRNQTYRAWEIILIDDGSEEEHSNVAKHYCRQHSHNIRYVEHEGHANRGVTISRNEAAKLAHGKYLAFLDADDVWLPGKLANQLARFASHPQAQAACEASIIWYSWQYENKENYLHPIGVPGNRCYAPRTLLKLLYPLTDKTSPAPSGIMILKETFDRLNGFEPMFSGIYELYEDQAFLSKIYLNEVVFISDTADIKYRQRNDSMSSAGYDAGRYYQVRSFYLDWLESYLSDHRICDSEINLLIEKAKQESMVALSDAMQKQAIF